MKYRQTAALVATILIAACGGGGGSGPGGVQDPVAGLAISTGNAETVAKLSYEAALGSGELADLGGNLGMTATSSGDFSKPSSDTQPAGFLVNVMQKIPFGPEVLPCAVSGFVTLSGNVANPVTLTAGDNFLVESDACDDGLGEVVDGDLSFTVAEFSGDVLAGAYLVSMDAVVDNLQVTTAEDTVTGNGDTRISLDTRTALFVTASVSGNSMTTDSNASSETLTNYSSVQTADVSATQPLYTHSASGTLQTTRLSGSIRYSTPLTFESVGQNYPHTGEMLISGESSSARLIAIDDVNVRIEVDNNGDGTVDDTIDTTWAELTA